MLYDYHVHTEFSDDSETPMEEMVRRALALGLSELCFTDHIDYGVKTDGGPKERRNCPRTPYFAKIRRLQEQYRGQIVLKAGMEFGMQPHTVEAFQKVFDAWPFDFILLSCHQVEDREFWNQTFQEGRTQREIHEAYYACILENVRRYRDYAVLAHLDMIKRYDPFGPYGDEQVLPMVEEILKQVIADGKGIEVNTSSARYGLTDLTPSRRILALYRELGGEVLTIGSDAHVTRDLGDRMEETMEQLRALGFRWLCTFDRMQPAFHAL